MMNKSGIIGIVVIIVILISVGFFWFVGEYNSEKEVVCVPSSCCHATECTLKGEAPNCSDRVCTMDCKPNTLDCEQGYCEFVNGQCEVVWNE